MYNKIPRSNQPQPGSYPNYAVGSGPGTTYYNYQVQQQQAVMEMMFGDESSRKRTRNQ